MARSDDPINLITMIGHADADLLPFFLDHYRRLGVGGFVLALHGDWDEEMLDRLDGEPDVHIWDLLDGVYGDDRRLRLLNGMAESFRGRWILMADADEFLELPCRTLRRTIQALEVLGLDCLPALMVQRQTADGSLPGVDPTTDLSAQFPCYNIGLCEQMGLKWPAWKTKFPLMRVTCSLRMRRGNHLPPNGQPIDHAPVRGVVHHFKWRAALRLALNLPRGAGSNSDEMRVYESWLNDRDWTLPTDGARICSREDLVARGFLVIPRRQDLQAGSLYRKIAKARNAMGPARDRTIGQLRRVNHAFGIPPRSDREKALVDPLNLLLKPGRVCLLTFELAPSQSGGIATAMTALAERLRAAGHEVDVLLCPFSGPQVMWESSEDYWTSRGVRLHYLPRGVPPDGEYQGQMQFCQAICATLEHIDPDLIHCADAAGYAVLFALLKAAGLACHGTKLVATAHGSTIWHNRGNQFQWIADESQLGFCHDVMMPLADFVCFPSDYMREVVTKAGLGIKTSLVLPNAMPGMTRSHSIGRVHGLRPVNELVLFGRIERRKGFSRFERAVTTLLDHGFRDFQVTLLGRFGYQVDPEPFNKLLNDERITTRHITNFNHVDAVNYLKGRDCLAVVASLCDNLPYTVYECLENGVPVLASAVGGIPELVHPDDRPRILIADDQDALVQALTDALNQGAKPARLAFDPDHADIELLAIHAKLIDEARHDRVRRRPSRREGRNRQKADIAALVYGDHALTTPCLVESLFRATADGRVRDIHLPPGFVDQSDPAGQVRAIEMMPGERLPAAIDRTVAGIDAGYLLFCHAGIVPDPLAVDAMRRLIEAAAFDAVVCGYRVGLVDGDDALTGPYLAPGGPPVLAPCHNLFGAGIFLIRRSAFERLGGFEGDDRLDELVHWVLLNRLTATGGRVVGIPRPLATVNLDHPGSFAALMDNGFAEALVKPWVDVAPPHVEDLIRKAIAADFGSCPTMQAVQEDLNCREGGEDHRAGFA